MSDVYLTDTGDIALSSNGDIALVDDPFRNFSQQAYIRMMTEQTDFVIYPALGVSLETLIGMPNSQSTGELGRQMILAALTREQLFAGVLVDVKSIPVSLDAIRFDIYITAGSRSEMVLSIEQDLTINNSLEA